MRKKIFVPLACTACFAVGLLIKHFLMSPCTVEWMRDGERTELIVDKYKVERDMFDEAMEKIFRENFVYLMAENFIEDGDTRTTNEIVKEILEEHDKRRANQSKWSLLVLIREWAKGEQPEIKMSAEIDGKRTAIQAWRSVNFGEITDLKITPMHVFGKHFIKTMEDLTNGLETD